MLDLAYLDGLLHGYVANILSLHCLWREKVFHQDSESGLDLLPVGDLHAYHGFRLWPQQGFPLKQLINELLTIGEVKSRCDDQV